jgi:hypothetical protein
LTQLWMATRGSYSDYQVLGVFSSEEKALDFKRKYNLKFSRGWDEVEIEEIELDQTLEEPVPMYIVHISGKEMNSPIYTEMTESTLVEQMTYIQWRTRAFGYLGGALGWSGLATGATPELALKNAQDMVAKKKAEVLGL